MSSYRKYRPYKDGESLGSIIQEILAPYAKDENFQLARIQEEWQTLMGSMIARQTSNIKLQHDTLFIYVQSVPLRFELLQSKEKIRSKMNEILGDNRIKNIEIGLS